MKFHSEYGKLNCTIPNIAQPSAGILWHGVEPLEVHRVLIGAYIVSDAIYHI